MPDLSTCVYLPVVAVSECPKCFAFFCYDSDVDTTYEVRGYDKTSLLSYVDQAINWSRAPLVHEQAVIPVYFLEGVIRIHMPTVYAHAYIDTPPPPKSARLTFQPRSVTLLAG